ncbi:hypothetical protein C8R47DRAFT_447496 [Mycena vitilis]|nr:hypothetical protein C8R47DRAFT_447496 [Mycena vitilis]
MPEDPGNAVLRRQMDRRKPRRGRRELNDSDEKARIVWLRGRYPPEPNNRSRPLSVSPLASGFTSAFHSFMLPLHRRPRRLYLLLPAVERADFYKARSKCWRTFGFNLVSTRFERIWEWVLLDRAFQDPLLPAPLIAPLRSLSASLLRPHPFSLSHFWESKWRLAGRNIRDSGFRSMVFLANAWLLNCRKLSFASSLSTPWTHSPCISRRNTVCDAIFPPRSSATSLPCCLRTP